MEIRHIAVDIPYPHKPGELESGVAALLEEVKGMEPIDPLPLPRNVDFSEIIDRNGFKIRHIRALLVGPHEDLFNPRLIARLDVRAK